MSDDPIAREPARIGAPARAQRVLASLVAGASVDEISADEKLQIARLETMIVKLIDRVEAGEPEAIDRLLKIVDRLDRYHGFSRASRAVESYDETERARLMKKLNDVAARLQAEKPPE
jgi:hypothetical protein